MRLACVRHAASVNSEPGSNSPVLLGVFPHSGSLFSFQRARFTNVILTVLAPMSRGGATCSFPPPPRAAPEFVTDPRSPVKHPVQKKLPVASCRLLVFSFQFSVFGFRFSGAQAFRPVLLLPRSPAPAGERYFSPKLCLGSFWAPSWWVRLTHHSFRPCPRIAAIFFPSLPDSSPSGRPPPVRHQAGKTKAGKPWPPGPMLNILMIPNQPPAATPFGKKVVSGQLPV